MKRSCFAKILGLIDLYNLQIVFTYTFLREYKEETKFYETISSVNFAKRLISNVYTYSHVSSLLNPMQMALKNH